MDAYSNGSHVWTHNAKGQIVTGVIESTSLMADGTKSVVIKFDNGRTVTYPSACVNIDSIKKST
ncbi:hypothetical protein EDD85DRAFT_810097 [Armillaria nabsnona]|nr:hypothetical protein EDD85DRAFT_810097 [Armillaria nabsnona]